MVTKPSVDMSKYLNIGDVDGSIHHSILAGGNVENVHIGDKNIYTRSPEEALRDYLRTAVTTYAMTQLAHLYKPASPPNEPYKFLDSFAIEDAEMFFGRDEVSAALHEKVIKNRLTVLHAKSGAGKTSLLQAGLAPRLLREGRIPIFARALHDPVLAVKQAVASANPGKWPDLLHKLSLTEFLGEVAQLLPRNVQELVLIWDQFEEFFIFMRLREQRESFIDDFARCYADKALPVRLIISLRKDYYSDLAEFERHIPTIFQNQIWLPPVDRQQATQAITAAVANLTQPVTYALELLDLLLDDLSHGDIELPHLQIICTELYKATSAMAQRTINLSTYDLLGRAFGILGNYLNGVLERFPGKDGTIAKTILKELVSSEATKRVMAYKILASRVASESNKLEDVLARLVNARLIRRAELDSEIVYEMAHEYLIAEIRQWISLNDLAFKQIEELLMREVVNWRIHGMLIPPDRLELIYEKRSRLSRIDDITGECLLRSALKADFAIDAWAELVGRTNVQIILGVLRDNITPIHRFCLIRSLSVCFAMPELSGLGDYKQTVRHKAADVLGRMGDTRAVAPLIATLKDESVEVRRGAAEALGRIGEAYAVDPLITALHDENEEVRSEAAKALGQIGESYAVDPLIAALHDENEEVRREATESLGRLGKNAVNPLITALKDESEWVRSGAAEALGHLGDAYALAPLIAALKDESEWVRSGAAEALGHLGDAYALESLVVALKDTSSRVRRLAFEALGRLGGPAIEPLIVALKDEDKWVRFRAAEALGQIDNNRTIDSLIVALKDENEWVRKMATESLSHLGDARAVEPIIAILNDRDDGVREGAAEALGRLRDALAVEPLVAALNDKRGSVRWRVVESLGKLGNPAFEPLIAALKGKSGRIRSGASEALGQLGDARAVEPLIISLKDGDWRVRSEAAKSLGKLGDARAVEPLITVLKETNAWVHAEAYNALRAIGTPEALQALKAGSK